MSRAESIDKQLAHNLLRLLAGLGFGRLEENMIENSNSLKIDFFA